MEILCYYDMKKNRQEFETEQEARAAYEICLREK